MSRVNPFCNGRALTFSAPCSKVAPRQSRRPSSTPNSPKAPVSKENLAQVYQPSDNQEVLERVHSALTNLYPAEETHNLTRIKPHVWVINQPGYNLMVIITHMLVIFDAEMFEALPEKRLECCEELLRLNAHHVRNSKFCLLKGAVHLRILCENEKITEARISDYLREFKQQYALLETRLLKQFYDENEPEAEAPAQSSQAQPPGEDQITPPNFDTEEPPSGPPSEQI